MTAKDSDSISISISGQVEIYRILKVFEFTSDRKMMSVLVKKDSKILLFTKGADSSIFPLAKENDSTHVDYFA